MTQKSGPERDPAPHNVDSEAEQKGWQRSLPLLGPVVFALLAALLYFVLR